MMGGRSWDDWIEEYSHAHEHPMNRLTHSFGIPMIVLSILLIPVCFFVTNLWMASVGLFLVGWIHTADKQYADILQSSGQDKTWW